MSEDSESVLGFDASDWPTDDYVSFDEDNDFSGKAEIEYQDGDMVKFTTFDEDGEKIAEVTQ